MRRVSLRDVVDHLRRLRKGRRRSLERFYAGGHDPFGFDSNPYEAAKFDDLLGVIGAGPFEHALEVGCSIGSFTERLAPRCGELLATDISQVAVERAQERLARHPNVRVERRTIPGEMPDGRFDLIVCSDVLYYLPTSRLRRTLALRALRPAGRPGRPLLPAALAAAAPAGPAGRPPRARGGDRLAALAGRARRARLG